MRLVSIKYTCTLGWSTKNLPSWNNLALVTYFSVWKNKQRVKFWARSDHGKRCHGHRFHGNQATSRQKPGFRHFSASGWPRNLVLGLKWPQLSTYCVLWTQRSAPSIMFGVICKKMIFGYIFTQISIFLHLFNGVWHNFSYFLFNFLPYNVLVSSSNPQNYYFGLLWHYNRYIIVICLYNIWTPVWNGPNRGNLGPWNQVKSITEIS